MRGFNILKRFLRAGRQIISLTEQFICPPRCVVCEKRLPVGENICSDCRKKLPFVGDVYCLKCGKPLEDEDEYCSDCRKKKHYFSRAVALWTYSPMLKKSLYRFKYSNKKCYGKYYAAELERRYGKLFSEWKVDAIVPVPLFKGKEKKRGYNQAWIVAKELSRLTGIPLEDKILIRIRNTVPQKKLDYAGRQKNLKGAFKITKSVVKLKKVLLIDDIYTTGSTVDEIAKIFNEAGIAKVYTATLCIGKGF